jgi:PAS domain S-box-containing protein
MRSSLERQVALWFALVCGITVSLGVVKYRGASWAAEDGRKVEQALEVLRQLGDFLALMADVETGARGYVVTGDPEYLEPYENARRRLEMALGQLERATADDPDLRAKVAGLRPPVDAKLKVSGEVVALRRDEGFGPARNLVATDRGKALMDEIRVRVAAMQAAERGRLSRRSAAAAAGERTLNALMIGGTAANLAILGVVFAIVAREMRLRRGAERRLRRSEEQFRGAYDAAAIGMALVAPDGRWLMVNRSLCRIVGFAEAELLGMTFRDITHPDDLEADLQQVRALLAGEIPSYQMEKRYFHKDGHVVWVVLGVSLVREEGGEPLHFVVQVEDITPRKEAEDELRRSEQRYRSLVGATTAIVWDTPASGEFETEQPGWGAFTGQSFDQLKGWG